MNRSKTRQLMLTGVLALSAGTACASAGDVLGGLNGNTITGEVRGVDRSRLQLRDDYSGRTQTLRVDTRTRVVYRDREYPVTALERGDVVTVRVTHDRNGERWADRIEVRQSVSDDGDYGGGGYSRTQRLDGTVTNVDVRRGAFVIQQSRSASYMVYVPNRINNEDERRFLRLRRGDRVRAEVRVLGRNQYELVRFR